MQDTAQTFDRIMPGELDLMGLADEELELRLETAHREVRRLDNEKARRDLRRLMIALHEGGDAGPVR